MKPLAKNIFLPIVRNALKEDLPNGDITTNSFIPYNVHIRSIIVIEDAGVVCGIDIARCVFQTLNSQIKFKKLKRDGEKVEKHTKVAQVEGKASSILKGERTALNFLGYLSGIATTAWEWTQILPHIQILDTRKTRPTLRVLEKYAARTGGIKNHRMNLSSGILIKENHHFIIKNTYRHSHLFKEKLYKVKKKYKKEIIIEAHTVEDFINFIHLPVDIIMLDNMSLKEIKKCLQLRKKYNPFVKIEISGGIKKYNAHLFKNLKIDRISIGSIIHSAPFLNVSLEIEKVLT